jgi:hypothetical protein
MSIYAYFNCHDCRQRLWLGKALHNDFRPTCFHIGGSDELPHWKREQLNQVLWKFLADHTRHSIDVRLEHEMTDAIYEYAQIGGDLPDDIGFEDYVRDWPGLRVGST